MDDRRAACLAATAVEVHQAARVSGHQDVAAGLLDSPELVVCHRDRYFRLANAERASEPAAEIRSSERHDGGTASLEETARRITDPEIVQHVARIVVRDRLACVAGGQLDVVLVEKRRELPYLVPLDAQELRQIVACHRGAAA